MNEFTHLLATASTRTPLGTWIMSASPIVAEAVGHAGFDWGLIDMEHTPLDMMDVVHMLQAVASTPMVPVVRVPWNDTVSIKRVLDAGVTTLMVPFVQEADEAASAVAAVRYPPHGRRGVAAMSRASKFGTTPNFLKTANAQLAVIVQLETVEALSRIDRIAGVEGIDALFIGPGDLSATMGHIGDTMHSEVLEVTTRAVQRARQLGMPIGTVGGTVEAVKQYQAMGFDYVAIGSDLSLLMRGAQAALSGLSSGGDARARPAKQITQGVY